MKQNTFFNGLPIYFANLDRSPERLERLLDDFGKYGITEFKRVAAFDGKTLSEAPKVIYGDHQVPTFHDGNYGHWGIFLSYLKMMEEFLKSDYEYGLFCDDDIDFYNSTKMNFNFYDTLEYHNPEFYNIRTSIMYWEYYENPQLMPGKLQRPPYNVIGQASIFNRKWVEKFLDLYNPSRAALDENFVLDVSNFRTHYTTPNSAVIAIDIVIEDEHALSLPIFKHIEYENSLCTPEYSKDFNLQIINNHNRILEPLDHLDSIGIDSFIKIEK